MSWLDNSVNENEGIEMIGGSGKQYWSNWEDYKRLIDWQDKRERELQDSIINGTSEFKCGQGILAYIKEQKVESFKMPTRKELEDIFKQFEDSAMQSDRKPQWFMSYGEVISYHKAGLLKDIMESYELCIGTKSLDFIREHYGEE